MGNVPFPSRSTRDGEAATIPCHDDAAKLPPIVDQEDVGPVVTGSAILLHRHALRRGPESGLEHFAMGVEAREVHTGDKSSSLAYAGKFVASSEQAAKFTGCAVTAPHGSKFDVTFPAARFGSGAGMADCEPGKLSATPRQYGISQTLLIHRANLAPHIEAFINGVRQLGACLQAKLFLTGAKFTEPYRSNRSRWRFRADRKLHERGEKPGPETKFLIEAHVFRAGRKRE
jgi:hypothetical protein